LADAKAHTWTQVHDGQVRIHNRGGDPQTPLSSLASAASSVLSGAAIALLTAVALRRVHTGLVSKALSSHIPGLPKTFKTPDGKVHDAKPIPGLVAATKDYFKQQGRPVSIPKNFPTLNEAGAARVARAYDAMPHNPTNWRTRRQYKKLASETLAQYQALERQGFRYAFMKTDKTGNIIDPYAKNPSMGYLDIRDKKQLRIFPTDAGYGHGGISAAERQINPLLQVSPVKWGGKPTTYNDLFRAVHDSYGHFAHGNPFFRAKGEERAWVMHAMMFSKSARGAMTAETRGQNTFLNYGPNAAHNKTASGATTIYADQKIGVMPRWAQRSGMPREVGWWTKPVAIGVGGAGALTLSTGQGGAR
jgi:hypothetical protein